MNKAKAKSTINLFSKKRGKTRYNFNSAGDEYYIGIYGLPVVVRGYR
jgi:hypothetical protein